MTETTNKIPPPPPPTDAGFLAGVDGYPLWLYETYKTVRARLERGWAYLQNPPLKTLTSLEGMAEHREKTLDLYARLYRWERFLAHQIHVYRLLGEEGHLLVVPMNKDWFSALTVGEGLVVGEALCIERDYFLANGWLPAVPGLTDQETGK